MVWWHSAASAQTRLCRAPETKHRAPAAAASGPYASQFHVLSV